MYLCSSVSKNRGFRGGAPRRRGSVRQLAGWSEGETSPSLLYTLTLIFILSITKEN